MLHGTHHIARESNWEALNQHYRDAQPEEVVRWAIASFAPRLALTCSFGGASGMVLLDMAMQINRQIAVLLIDTGRLFGETYTLVEQIEQQYGIHVQRVRATLSLDEQSAMHGADLHVTDPDRCCTLRKVIPLAQGLAPYDAWLTAIRRDQSATRSATPVIAWNDKYQLVKICPLAAWTERDIWAYINAHNVPYNPLLDQGYPSLGCAVCTQRPTNADPRSGRWVGSSKTECGLHSQMDSLHNR